ncbi:glycoside hydrolase family 25 protein [Caproicibacter fermentans]|uniref:Uncharacterized protein n=1 Tax=Caproicibacter fermentans TaxID=2576756 RepID=A0A7G8TDX0_9FIRM|nr:glycoside hydrolase family 25 protein [Caproicibacter fermentans]QNK41811.1 hypothetical protein HCR03_06090 [Caproicibacter fermentans]
MATNRGIDVSSNNGTVDWAAAKAAGLNYAILRCGYGDDIQSQDDGQFGRNVSECERLGIPWGAYLYSYAMTVGEVPSEIQHTLRLLKGKRPSYPIYFDMEDADGYKARHGGIPPKQTITDIIKAYCKGMEAAGYFAGWYSNKDWRANRLFPDQLVQWTFWYARPGVSKPEFDVPMWQDQIGETGGHWPGVKGNAPKTCDTDICYTDFPSIIKNAGLNGWGKAAAVQTPNPPYTCDTSGTVKIARGSAYQAKITAPSAPHVVAGTPNVVAVLPRYNSGNDWFYYFVPFGNSGSETGIYINGGPRQFVAKIE